MTLKEVLIELNSLSTPDHFAKLAHFGISDSKALGVKVPHLRKLAKKIGKNHELALELWETDIHEARMLASMIENPENIDEMQFDAWVNDFDSWDLCDVCCDLLVKTTFSLQKIQEYSIRAEEFVKRAAFVLMCELALHYMDAVKNSKRSLALFEVYSGDEFFYKFLEIIEREAWDERNFVRKAVNWALRQIGKRNETLRIKAIETAERILLQDSKSARWIANDALKELNSLPVIARSKYKLNRS